MVPLRAADTLIESAQQTAALLTAAAFGPTSHRCYVAPTDCDLGLFARIDIPAGTPICEYAGPMLPREWQQQSGYNLGIPGGDGGVGGADRAFFIDGASEQAPFVDDGRSLGTYANHSSLAPNAGYRWRVAEKRMPHALSGALWIEALEPIAANTEIRVNYEAEGRQGQYWSALGIEPSEGDWKAVKMPPLPPTCHGLEDVEGFEGSLSPLPWEGARGGDERLRVLVRTLAPHCTYPVSGAIRPELLGVVATHIPGRSALECYRRWCQLMCAEGAGGKAKRGGAGANGTDRAALADGSLAALLPEAGACFCGTKRHLPSSGLDFNGLCSRWRSKPGPLYPVPHALYPVFFTLYPVPAPRSRCAPAPACPLSLIKAYGRPCPLLLSCLLLLPLISLASFRAAPLPAMRLEGAAL